jgi:hypothetical protein
LGYRRADDINNALDFSADKTQLTALLIACYVPICQVSSNGDAAVGNDDG